jgi:hypothetical protein
MMPMMIACLTCLTTCFAAGKPMLPTLDATGPTAQAEVDSYDLCASYDADSARREIGLVFERVDERNLLVLEATERRTQLARLDEGRETVLGTGPGVKTEEALELTVRRRPGVVRVFGGARLLMEAYDSTFQAGACGSETGEGIKPPSQLYVQEIGDIELTDDFFVGGEREGLWENLLGALKINIYWDPKQKVDDRPIGACWFANDGSGESLAATGASFWDDYACEVSVRPDADSTVGLAFRVRDRANYAMLTLSPEADGGVTRLIEVSGGTPRVCCEQRGTWPSGHWYRLRAEVVGAGVRGYVAGEPVGQTTLGSEASGRVGVYARTDGDCRFDDLSVRGLRRITPQAKPQPAGPWRFVSGAWKAKGTQLTCRAASTAVAVASVGAWKDSDVRVSVRPSEGVEAGVVARWSAEGGYALVARRQGSDLVCRLERVAGGTPETLSEARTGVPAAGDAQLRLTACGAALRGFVGGTCVLRAWDDRFAAGDAGVITQDGRAAFTGFSASEAAPEDVVSELMADGSDQSRPGAEHGAFEPFIGQLWRPVAGRASLTNLDGEPAIALRGGALRYYSLRPGDVILSTDVLRSDGQAISLGICADVKATQGYRLSMTGQDLGLTRNGETVAEGSTGSAPPLGLSLRRDGPFVVGQAGDAVLTYRDPQPLPAGHAEVRATGQAVIDNLDLGAAHALAYRFDRVEPDWVEASGGWMFHSGMACIPWAYWLSGDGRETPALIWNRREAPASLAVRLDVSEYTVGYESGYHEHFPYHDISLVLSGDGKATDSGYRFVIGAEGGRATRLLRKGQVVAETSDPRFHITMGSHCNTPRAIEVVAVKHGGSLELWLNGVQALSYQDPEPLGNGRVALGVEKCRANFRDLFLYRDETWLEPLGVAAFSPD